MNNKFLHRNTKPDLVQLARQNRKLSTDAEELLWEHLRGRKLNGFKFRRQQPMASFILDFFCLEANLAIEIDGEYHNEEEQKIYDESRTVELNSLHITILRFTNHEVINTTQSVLTTISEHLTP